MAVVTTTRFPRKVPHEFVLHPPTLLPLVPWIVVISALGSTPRFSLTTFGMWLIIHTATLAIAAAAGWLFAEGLHRFGTTDHTFGGVVATGAVMGAAKAVATTAAEITFLATTPPTEALIARGVGAIVVGVWVVTLAAYGKTALVRLGEARDALIRQNVAHRLAEETVVTPPQATESLHRISALRDALTDGQKTVSADEIRDVVDSTIRPLSRAMWSVESKRYPQLRLLSLYKVALQSLKVKAFRIALIWSLTSFTALAVPLGVVDAALYSLTVGVFALAVFSVVRLGWTRSVVASLIVVSFASLGAVSLGFLAFDSVAGLAPESLSIAVVVTGAAWMVFVVIGSSIISGVQELRDTIRHDLASNTTQDLIRQRTQDGATAASTKLLATKLHGSVQSSLLALANALERQEISAEDVASRLTEISRQVEQVSHGFDPSIGRPSAGDVEQLTSSWRGLMRVVIDPDSEATLDTACQESVETLDIVREALTNARRHGQATEVVIHAVTDPAGTITLTVTDNGYGPRKGPPGLGSTLLDTWTHNRWSLHVAPEGGSVLVATITPSTSAVSDPH